MDEHPMRKYFWKTITFVSLLGLATIFLVRYGDLFPSAVGQFIPGPPVHDFTPLEPESFPEFGGDTLSGGETGRHEIIIEPAKGFAILCFSDGYIRMTLIDPHGVRFDSSFTRSDSSIFYSSEHSDEMGYASIFKMGNNPPPGKWTLEVEGEKNIQTIKYGYFVSLDGPEIDINVHTDKENYQRNDTIVVLAELKRNSSPILNAQVTAYVNRALDRSIGDTLQLLDDGTRGDKTPGDGQYTNIITNTSDSCTFYITVRAENADPVPFSRELYIFASVSHNRAHFNGKFIDYGRDTNGDSLFDELVVEAGIDIIDPNIYRFNAALRIPDGPKGKPAKGEEYIASVISGARTDTFLTAGTHNVILAFPGKDLNDKHIDGPYQFEQLSAFVEDTEGDFGGELVDDLGGIYLTKKYSAWDFQGEGVMLIGNFRERPIDIDGDGLYDSLVISLDIDVRKADTFIWQATLFGGRERADFAYVEKPLQRGVNSIEFPFQGFKIRNSGIDGPYQLVGIGVTGRITHWGITELGGFKTRTYKHTDFE
jgi:hypothetical protein